MPLRGKIAPEEVLEMSETDKAKAQVAATDEFGGIGGIILQRLDMIDKRFDRI